nr:neverland [Diaphanosoma celebensis]
MEAIMVLVEPFYAADLATADLERFAVKLVVAIGVAVLVYVVLFRPLDRVKDLCDTGYGHQISTDRYGRSKRDLVNQVRRMKKRGSIPPVFPNGWFAILESQDLKVGQVRAVDALGENWVVFRTEEGKAAVLDAYCPHLGAHLAIGGKVVGNNIECPFHGWQFRDRDGQCTAVPYAKKVPEFARVPCWPVREVNGFIFVWYHAEKKEPLWHVPVIPEVESKRWVYRGRTDYLINAHIQEIPENGADVAHLGHLHAPSMLFGSDLRVTSLHGTAVKDSQSATAKENPRQPKVRSVSTPFKWSISSLLKLRHHWTVQWNPEAAPNSHIAVSQIRHDLRLLEKWPFIVMNVKAEQVGPGLVHLSIDTSLGKCVIIQTVTPVEPLVQRVLHRMYTASSLIAPYAKLILWGEAIMFERDVMVWNHKTYIDRPVLVAEDKTLVKHRRWYQQFYSENSPRLGHQKNDYHW